MYIATNVEAQETTLQSIAVVSKKTAPTVRSTGLSRVSKTRLLASVQR